MKKVSLLFFVVTLLFASCEKDDTSGLSESNNYEVHVEIEGSLIVGYDSEPILVKVNITSEEKGFPFTVSLISDESFSHIFPDININNQSYFGLSKSGFLNNTDTTIVFELSPTSVPSMAQSVSFEVYIDGNNSKYPKFTEDANLGLSYASVEIDLEAAPPKIITCTPILSNLTNNSVDISIGDFSIWHNSYERAVYGVVYSKDPNPTIEDSVASKTVLYLYSNSVDFDAFNTNIQGLTSNSTYYIRPFVSIGKTSYGEEIEVKTPGEDYLASEYLQLGVYYLADDGLSVRMNSVSTILVENHLEYTIRYTIINNTEDQVITEGSFALFSTTGEEKKPQYGAFSDLYPGESTTRSYVFKSLSLEKYHFVEYNTDWLVKNPSFGKLKWGLEN